MGKHLYKTGKRKCYICKKILPLTKEFFWDNKSKRIPFGYGCKKCELEKKKQESEKHKKYHKEWYLKNREQDLAKKRKRYFESGGKKYSKADYLKNKNKILKRLKEKYHSDIQFKLRNNLRKRLCEVLNGKKRVGSAIRDLGCSIEQLKTHLESQFQPGMTWDNWGFYGWHIDHILPLSSFDLTDKEQFLKACHYTNLQPLWATDNLKKGHKTL